MHKGKSNIEIVKDYLAGERPFVQVGYQGEHHDRKVGERWEDLQGITWEKTKWGVTRINKQADSIRKMLEQKCGCGQDIKYGTKRDELFFQRTGMCENCLINYETGLRVLGIYDTYEQYKLLSNEYGFVVDAEQKVNETLEFAEKDDGSLSILCNGEGFLEKFHGYNSEEFIKQVKADLKILRKRIVVVGKAKEKAKKNYEKLCKKFKVKAYVGQ
jgi:hypothetical protein